MQTSSVSNGAQLAALASTTTLPAEKGERREPDGDRDDKAVQASAPTALSVNLLGQRVGTIINTQA